ncbi:O-acetyl-ADP-ribose deacetylase [Specibacter cremeus]|uniref:O-acetyl-ADP-ribose deacetylase n=1 Tax=Specibacter cremeus TaxID=1629051 RepID=UPI000F77C22D|nr:O-acetyl-ADP-ribose deacetylase [Specibacter cremeus]
MHISVMRGDITALQVDAIVNAANSSLLGGGGVDGAIHAAAGPDLLAECRELRRHRFPDGLPAGDAVATGAGNLPARWVIHTVGPDRHAGQTDAAVLRSCFTRSLAVARGLGAATVAFPAIGGGAYGWSPVDVAQAASEALSAWRADVPDSVILVAFDAGMERAFRGIAARPAARRRTFP